MAEKIKVNNKEDKGTKFRIDDTHNWTSAKIPEIDPYPELTERERRFMVSFYRQNYIQLLSNKRILSTLNRVNENLLKMLQDELNK